MWKLFSTVSNSIKTDFRTPRNRLKNHPEQNVIDYPKKSASLIRNRILKETSVPKFTMLDRGKYIGPRTQFMDALLSSQKASTQKLAPCLLTSVMPMRGRKIGKSLRLSVEHRDSNLACITPIIPQTQAFLTDPISLKSIGSTQVSIDPFLSGLTREFMSSMPEMVQKIVSIEMATQKQVLKINKKIIIKSFQAHQNDTGSPEVIGRWDYLMFVVGVLTIRLVHLLEHLKNNRHDFVCQRLVIQLIQRRRRMLVYLKRLSLERYFDTIQKLDIRHTDLV